MGLRAGSLGGLSRFGGLGLGSLFFFFLFTLPPYSTIAFVAAISLASTSLSLKGCTHNEAFMCIQQCMAHVASQEMSQAPFCKAQGIDEAL